MTLGVGRVIRRNLLVRWDRSLRVIGTISAFVDHDSVDDLSLCPEVSQIV